MEPPSLDPNDPVQQALKKAQRHSMVAMRWAILALALACSTVLFNLASHYFGWH